MAMSTQCVGILIPVVVLCYACTAQQRICDDAKKQHEGRERKERSKA